MGTGPFTCKTYCSCNLGSSFWSTGRGSFYSRGALGPVNIAYSGVYQWWYTIGLRTNEDLYTGALFLLFLSAISLIAGWLHLQPKWKPSVSWFKNAESRLNHHLSGLFGVSSLAWTGHLVHVAIPGSRGEYVRWNNFLDVLPHPQGLGPLFTGQWNLYAQNPDSSSHLFGTSQGAGTAILTLLGGFHPQTQSLWLTDIAHHHLAIAFIFLVAGHMYRTNFGIGHSIKDLLDAHIPPGGRLGRGHKGLYDTINNSLHFQLGLALASLGVITSLVAQHMYSLPAYAFIAQDFTTQAALYTHHQYIAGFIMTGAFAHGAIFFIRDYNPEQNEDNVLARMLDHKEAIISHLSPGDFLVHHAIALGLHTTTLILVKGALDARGSKLMPDKKDFGYSFPCDGPGRGELIETLAWAHERTPLANLIRWRDKPVALSIVQARLDLNHYGKEKFDSEGEEEAKIGTEISFDSSILKKEISKVPSLSDKWEIYGKLQSPPRNSALQPIAVVFVGNQPMRPWLWAAIRGGSKLPKFHLSFNDGTLLISFFEDRRSMIFLFILPLLLPLNQTFPCHNGSGPISIHDTSRILDVEI
ncbi:UNVERIFIED_CONTAM: Photosystem I chlorophyll a apoprotein A2 [Sesamum indicum]